MKGEEKWRKGERKNERNRNKRRGETEWKRKEKRREERQGFIIEIKERTYNGWGMEGGGGGSWSPFSSPPAVFSHPPLPPLLRSVPPSV